MREFTSAHLLDICISMSGAKDRIELLEHILTAAMDITECDGGTLYIKTGDVLAFHLMVTRSNGTLKGGRYGTIDLPPVPISRSNACACALLDRSLLNFPDVYQSDRFDFSGPRQYDALTGYKTSSMLVVPMEDDKGQVIGVLQLINALQDGKPVPFSKPCEHVILALSSQAAICLTNMNYAAAVQALLSSLISVLSTAIDARSPYNANHTRNMARYAERFIDWLNDKKRAWYFSAAERNVFLMSVWLHDVGKLTTPLFVMNKETRLGDGLERLLIRFETILLLGRIKALESGGDVQALEADLKAAEALIHSVNRAGFLTEEQLEAVRALRARSYVDARGITQRWISEAELDALSVRKGTLTAQERSIMENHVRMTERILNEVQFTADYVKAPVWAAQHHEFLNGTGYPRGLAGKAISRETRLLTILDIFDALTATDRPYKSPMPVKKALGILHSMVADGQLDGEILAFFIESRAWEDAQ